MVLAAHRVQSAPDKVKGLVQRRNALLYREIVSDLEAQDAARASADWQEAMTTCYACHQGREAFPVLRRFTPIEAIHSKHQRIAADLEQGCADCHRGTTAMRGYK